MGIDLYESMLQKIDEDWKIKYALKFSGLLKLTYGGIVKMAIKKVAKKQINAFAAKQAEKLARQIFVEYSKSSTTLAGLTKSGIEYMFNEIFKKIINKLILKVVNIPEEDIKKREQEDVKTQFAAYVNSIKSGHGVIVVSHSQGNLFTNIVYDKFKNHWLPWDEDTKWMRTYFRAIGIATPANDILGKQSPYMTFDNDIIGIIPNSLKSNVTNPKRYYFKNALEEKVDNIFSLEAHSFLTSYMATDITKDAILGFIEQEVKEHKEKSSQWKPKKLACTCKKKYAKMTHIHDPDSMDKYLKNYKVKDFVEGEAGKIYVAKKEGAEVYVKATYGGVNIEEVDEENSDVCYALKDDAEDASTIGEIEGAKTPQVMAQNGAIEVTINWSHMCDINMDLTLEGNNVIQDVKDVENLSFEHAYVASKAQIYPNTTYTAYAYGNKKENSGLEEEELEDDPVIIHAVVKTPSNSRFAVYEAKDYESLNLKRFAWIEIEEDKSTSSGTSSGGGSSGGSGGGGGTRPYDECIDSDKKYTCACVPCEYIIKGFKNSVILGVKS